MGPRVSVCIDNYNYAEFLPRAIESVLRQDYPRVELIVVDDGSSDDSPAVMARYRGNGRFITKPNGGQASTLNVAFSASSGDIVMFLDADDALYPDAVSRVVEHWSADLSKVQFRLAVVDPAGRTIGSFPHREVPLPQGDVVTAMLRAGTYPTPTTSGNAYSRRALQSVMPIPEEDFRVAADGYLNAVVPFCGPIRSIDAELGIWHQHGANTWGGRGVELRLVRQRLEHTLGVERYVRREAAARGHDVPVDLSLRDPEHALYRMLSLRLDPAGHAAPADRRVALLRAGLAAVRGHHELGLARRISWLAAVVVVGLAPRPWPERAAGLLLSPRPRPRWLRTTARALDRAAERARPRRTPPEARRGADGDIRVLFLITSLQVAGAERNLVSLLPALRTAGADPALCTLHPSRDGPLDREVERLGIRRIDLGGKRLLDAAAWRALRTRLRTEPFDVIHAEDQYSHILAWAAARGSGIPVVMTRHVMRESTPSFADWSKARLENRALRAADRVIAVSDAVRESLAATVGVPPWRISTIRNGIEIGQFATAGSVGTARQGLGWPAAGHVVTMIGALRAHKGHDVLLGAAPRIQACVPDTSVVLVGSGDREMELRRMAARSGAQVVFLGERADVATILAASDVVVLPSWTEALPTVLLEAGAAGRPVVATRVGGSAEIVVEGDTGYLVAPGDVDALATRVIELLTDPARGRELGEHARRRIEEHFSIPRQAAETLAVYEALHTLGRPARRSP